MKLYRLKEGADPAVWIGEDHTGALVTWPAEAGGWNRRSPYTGPRGRALLEIAPGLARGSGWPGAGRGKPPVSASGETSDRQLTIRTTEGELATWRERAEEAGKPPSTWARDTLNTEVARSPRTKGKP